MNAQKRVSDMTAECALLMTAAASAAIGSIIGHPDMAAIAGGMLAAVFGLMDAAEKQRSLAAKVKIVLGTAFFGSALPGATLWAFRYMEWTSVQAKDIPWHVWGLAGCMFGAVGWILAWGFVQAVEDGKGGMIRRTMRYILPKWMTETEPGKPKRK